MRILSKVALSCCIALGFSSVANADEVSIGAARDNTLYEDDNGDFSNGAGDHFFAGLTVSGQLRRGLLYFDIASAIPAGSMINDAILTLHMSRAVGDEFNVSLHEALADWGEGTSDSDGSGGGGGGGVGAPSTAGDATWIHTFFPGSLWNTAGGDFDPLASATTSVGMTIGTYGWNSSAMTEDIQNWLDNPGSNFGWVVVGTETNLLGEPTSKRFDSRENPNANVRPSLTINFTPIPEPAASGVLALAALVLGSSRRRR